MFRDALIIATVRISHHWIQSYKLMLYDHVNIDILWHRNQCKNTLHVVPMHWLFWRPLLAPLVIFCDCTHASKPPICLSLSQRHHHHHHRHEVRSMLRHLKHSTHRIYVLHHGLWWSFTGKETKFKHWYMYNIHHIFFRLQNDNLQIFLFQPYL